MITLTAEEQRILLNPTRIEEWGAQQKVAREVQQQILALAADEIVTIDDIDIFLINAASAANREGLGFASGKSMAGGWKTESWQVNTNLLKQAIS